MVRGVRGAEAQMQVERLGRVNLLDVSDELDRLVDQVLTEVVPLLGRARRLHLVVVVHQIRIPLAGVTAQEAIKALEAAPQENARDACASGGLGHYPSGDQQPEAIA